MNTKAVQLLVSAALLSVLAAPAMAQGELERLGGGPGGVPQVNPRLGGFFNERAGPRTRPSVTPTPAAFASPAAESPEEASDETPDIAWNAGLVSVEADRVPAGDFLMEFNRQTGIPVRLEPGVTHRVTATFKNLRLERALPILFPAGGWLLVRKPNTALRDPNAYAGLVVHPPVERVNGVPVQHASQHQPPRHWAKAKVGGMNFGPAFEVPGEPAPSASPAAIGEITVDESDADPRITVPATGAHAGTTPASTPSPLATSDDASRRRIAELVEQKLKKKKE